MLNHLGEVKLADFGLARELFEENEWKSNTFLGTQAYLAPERLLSEEYSYSADIWSFGLSVMYCLVGALPKECEDYWQLLDMVNKKSPSLPDSDEYSEQVRDFVDCCLKLNPHQRHTAAQLLKHAWINDTHIHSHHTSSSSSSLSLSLSIPIHERKEWRCEEDDLEPMLEAVANQYIQSMGGEKEGGNIILPPLSAPSSRRPSLSHQTTKFPLSPSGASAAVSSSVSSSSIYSSSIECLPGASALSRSSSIGTSYGAPLSSSHIPLPLPLPLSLPPPLPLPPPSPSLSSNAVCIAQPPIPELDAARLLHLSTLFNVEQHIVQQRFVKAFQRLTQKR